MTLRKIRFYFFLLLLFGLSSNGVCQQYDNVYIQIADSDDDTLIALRNVMTKFLNDRNWILRATQDKENQITRTFRSYNSDKSYRNSVKGIDYFILLSRKGSLFLTEMFMVDAQPLPKIVEIYNSPIVENDTLTYLSDFMKDLSETDTYECTVEIEGVEELTDLRVFIDQFDMKEVYPTI